MPNFKMNAEAEESVRSGILAIKTINLESE
jgi:hypothetical protein